MNNESTVRVWEEEMVIPTYLPDPPDKNPMFLETRVYQGSSGKVYPLPFTDRIAETKVDRAWRAVWLENEHLKVMILPEIGGRIHIVQDKSNGYDVIYRQNVIKPALVGLAGPWISGGIEFNWPQHHRPATFLPVDFDIERHADGSCTVWCSDHDPMTRMKGMHGVCLHPGKAIVELKVRACNRTQFVQTFLWWANVACRVHEGYQSFFPPDVTAVADHAKRATSEYPLCKGSYYGVPYGERAIKGVPEAECPSDFVPPSCLPVGSSSPSLTGRGGVGPDSSPSRFGRGAEERGGVGSYPPNDLSWYANIPVPTSYMCIGTKEGFFGGYDHFAQAGLIHYADPAISPGKKQWTWGNHEFGYAWDRSLTDADGPYVELMAGVYTDNQPDFSYLQPGETKTWSQFWYPIQKIGPAQHANVDAAVRLDVDDNAVKVGVCVSSELTDAVVRLSTSGSTLREWRVDLVPGQPFQAEAVPANPIIGDGSLSDLGREMRPTLTVVDRVGREVIAYTPSTASVDVPLSATEPAPPSEVESIEELYLIGLHLQQYRHATRSPEPYWREALRRDPLDARCNNALGLRQLRRGEWDEAEKSFQSAIARLTKLNPNPYDGEPCYNLGLCLRHQADAFPNSSPSRFGRGAEERGGVGRAHDAFAKAAWNQAWAGASWHAMAEIDCRREDWSAAREHLGRALRLNADNLRARNLMVIVLRRLGLDADARALLHETLAVDPLDWWARHLAGESVDCDAQTCLDVAHDYARAGLYREAIALLESIEPQAARDLPKADLGSTPMVDYTIGWFYEKAGEPEAAFNYYERASAQSPDYCFPARLEEIAVLEAAMRADPSDARAPYYLGNLLYDRGRQADAIAQWERSVDIDPSYSVAWRNLGIGFYNVRHDAAKARDAYERAVNAAPSDARLIFERDQLWKRTGESPNVRLEMLEARMPLVSGRDDLSVELCALYNLTGHSKNALDLLMSRTFQPWEGGEGQALGEWTRAHLLLGQFDLSKGDAVSALAHFQAAITPPHNLGEARHLLANCSDIHYRLGQALNSLGRVDEARAHWMTAASFRGDFQEMSVRRFSEMTYYSALAWKALSCEERAEEMLGELMTYARELEESIARIDYFATSLPTMLLFVDDIQARQTTTALFLQAQAHAGLGHVDEARELLKTVLQRDANHAAAIGLLEEM